MQTRQTFLLYQGKSDNRSEYSWDTSDTWEPNTHTDQFRVVHSILYHTFEEWTTNPMAKQNAFYAEWLEAKYLGLTSVTAKSKVFEILKTSNYGSYILYMQQIISSTWIDLMILSTIKQGNHPPKQNWKGRQINCRNSANKFKR
jgi:hypothetical protein